MRSGRATSIILPHEHAAPVEDAGFRWPDDRPPDAATAPVPAPLTSRTGARVRAAIVALAGTSALALLLAPAPDGLSPEAKAAVALFVFCTSLWIANALPIGMTGLLAVALLGLTRVLPPADAFAAFGSSAVFFILGVFILAAALIHSGLSKRLALLFLVRFGRTPHRLAFGMMLAAAVTTTFMPAQATCAMLFPIAFEIARAMRLPAGHSAYGKILFLSLAWGAMVGSNASFLGSTRAPLALGMLHNAHGMAISFGQWMLAALPLVVGGVLFTPLILRRLFRHDAVDAASAHASLAAAVAALGPIGARQLRVAAITLATIAAWILLGARVDLAIIAILSAGLLFATRTLRWEELDGYIHWNIVLMYGGAIALGVAIDRTGAAQWVVDATVGPIHVPAYVAITGLAIATLILSEFMSNAAAVAVMLPLAFSLGAPLGVSPQALVLATSIGGGLAFTLPISSAPNAIAFASGYLDMTDYLRAGLLMTIASIILLLAVAAVWWPLIGIL